MVGIVSDAFVVVVISFALLKLFWSNKKAQLIIGKVKSNKKVIPVILLFSSKRVTLVI